MRITVLGTGMVGRTLAARLSGLGHDVVIGTRDVDRTLARTESDAMGTVPYPDWQNEHPAVGLMNFPEAGAFGHVILNAIHGTAALGALHRAGADNLAGKPLLDIALPLDFTDGMPPTLTIANDDSLAEQIQRAYPDTRVVKTLNTVFVAVMVDPTRIPGTHNIFVAGNDPDAKQTAVTLLHEFGWSGDAIIDLGGIRAARAAEMYSRLFFELAQHLGNYDFNIAVMQ